MRDGYYIPANFTDAGKILGAFPLRNAVEALLLAAPLFLVILALPYFTILTRLMAALILAVPVGGFALIGIRDESLLQFAATWLRWRRNRSTLVYRGWPEMKRRAKWI